MNWTAVALAYEQKNPELNNNDTKKHLMLADRL
jgi:hypothetical protein